MRAKKRSTEESVERSKFSVVLVVRGGK